MILFKPSSAACCFPNGGADRCVCVGVDIDVNADCLGMQQGVSGLFVGLSADRRLGQHAQQIFIQDTAGGSVSSSSLRRKSPPFSFLNSLTPKAVAQLVLAYHWRDRNTAWKNKCNLKLCCLAMFFKSGNDPSS